MRTLSATLLAAHLARSAQPYIHLNFTDGATSYDYSQPGDDGRILSIEHEESPYSEEAEIILNNSDLAVPDLRGYYTDLGYGYVADGNEYETYPRLWVVAQHSISAPNSLQTRLILWGAWNILTATPIDDVGTAPNHFYAYEQDTTPLDIATALFAANDITLTDSSADDGITDTFMPYFELNTDGGRDHESYQGALYRIISTTKKYYRMLEYDAGLQCELIYPQDEDTVDETYYTKTTDGYMTAKFFGEQLNEMIPNKVVAYCNQDEDGGWTAMITGTAEDATASARFDPLGKGNIIEYLIEPRIDDQDDADNYAEARLVRAKAQLRSTYFEIPHDSRMQLYDRPQIIDTRGI